MNRNARMAVICLVAALGMVGAAYAAVPLYRAFCQATGFDGTVKRAKAAPSRAIARSMSVRFDTNVNGVPFDFRIFLQIVLPLARPALATLAVLSFLANWNDFLWPVYVLLSPENLTLQPGLSQLQGAYSTHYAIVMAGAVIASVPVLILFFFAQKQIVESVATSGVKG